MNIYDGTTTMFCVFPPPFHLTKILIRTFASFNWPHLDNNDSAPFIVLKL